MSRRSSGSDRSTDQVRRHSELSEAEQLERVNRHYGMNADVIQYFTNPSEAVQLAAVTHKGFILQWLPNPSEAVQLAAIRQPWARPMNSVTNDAWNIRYIKDPTERVQLEAVEQIPSVLREIARPTRAVQMAAVSADPSVIQFITNPSVSVLLAAGQMTKRKLRGNSSFFFNARIENTVHHEIFDDRRVDLYDFCTGDVVSEWWQEEYMARVGNDMYDNYWGIKVYDVDRPGWPDKVVGFAVFHLDDLNEDPTGYTEIDRHPRCNVDLLCCNQAGIGSYVVWTIETFMRDRGVSLMVCTPVPSSHGFRRKLGYRPAKDVFASRGHRPETRAHGGTASYDDWWFKWTCD